MDKIGHISRYLKDRGADIFGIDLSEIMIEVANEKNHYISFMKGDMLNLGFEKESLGGAIFYYSIVHFTLEEVEKMFKGLWNVLEDNGVAFIAFHVGDQVLHLNSLFDEKVELDYMFFNTDSIVSILKKNNYKIIEAITRDPYKNYEYNSKKGYILCQKVKDSDIKIITR